MINVDELFEKKLTVANKLAIEEAISRGVSIERISSKRIKMEYGNSSYIVRNGIVSNAYNSKLARKCTNLKGVTSQLLRSRGYPAPENAVFRSHDLQRAWSWAEPILPVVLKPNNGILGKRVFVNINNFDEFEYAFKNISEKYKEILVEEFCSGEEYRFTFVDGEIVAVANRKPANVVGDGISTIEELVKKKNKERKERKNPIHKRIKINDEVLRVLKLSNMDLQSIPEKDKVVYLRKNSNIATGGDAIDVTDEIDNEIKELVAKAASSIHGLKVCGLDVIINEDNISILEINSHAMLSMHHYPWVGKPRNVVGKLIEAMFPDLINNDN